MDNVVLPREEITNDFERVYVTFTDDVLIADEEKELVVTINVEWAFDVPTDQKFLDGNLSLAGSPTFRNATI